MNLTEAQLELELKLWGWTFTTAEAGTPQSRFTSKDTFISENLEKVKQLASELSDSNYDGGGAESMLSWDDSMVKADKALLFCVLKMPESELCLMVFLFN